jgi:hypothetical protein
LLSVDGVIQFNQQENIVKAQIGDYIKTENGLQRVVKADESNGYELDNGQVLADSDITIDDVLLESEVAQ